MLEKGHRMGFISRAVNKGCIGCCLGAGRHGNKTVKHGVYNEVLPNLSRGRGRVESGIGMDKVEREVEEAEGPEREMDRED